MNFDLYSDCWRAARSSALILLALAATASRAGAGDFYRWTQYSSVGLEARAITTEGACPKAVIDGREVAMTVRAQPDDAFSILVCTAAIPKDARTAAIEGRPLALPPARPDKILVIGDTGCRLKALFLQDCNSLQSWPFRLAAETAARFAPDLVVHVGDYYYRESACPPLRQGCAGSPHGDNWAAWRADFFDPGESLLQAAPWVFVRGNHESCERGWRGWTRTLDAHPLAPDGRCEARERPFTVDLGGLTLLVLDVTAAEDRVADMQQAQFFKTQLAAAGAIDGPVWYAFHKPIFSSIKVSGAETIGDNKTLVEAARGGVPGNVQAILSGHLHTLQVASYASDFPAQFVVGNGGDTLDPYAPAKFDGLTINGLAVEQGRSLPTAFGFATFERREGDWLFTAYGVRGEPLMRCHLRGRKVDCE
jgi:hypothetical protein